MTNHYGTPNAFNALATKKDRAAQSAAFAALVRWCRAHRAAHLDDCGEVDVTALALACAEAHGCEDPGEHHPAWDAATAACGRAEQSRNTLQFKRFATIVTRREKNC